MNYENNTFSDVPMPKPLSATRAFFQSQSIIAKLAFLALTLIVFVILLKVITKIMIKVLAPSKSPYLLKDLKPANVPTTISQDPNVANAIPLVRSTNQKDGIEFTYSLWMYVHGIPEITEKQFHQVFFKGISVGSQVWMSHSDTIKKLPTNAVLLASTTDVENAAYKIENEQSKVLKNLFSLLSHLSSKTTNNGN